MLSNVACILAAIPQSQAVNPGSPTEIEQFHLRTMRAKMRRLYVGLAALFLGIVAALVIAIGQ